MDQERKMFLDVFSIICILTRLHLSNTFEANSSDWIDPYCYVQLGSKADDSVDQDRLKVFNQTVQQCEMRGVYLNYEITSQNEESGESLADFNNNVFPLVAQISNLSQLSLLITGGRGISVDFKIPRLSASTQIFFMTQLFDLRLVYNNGHEVRESSAGLLDTSPFKNEQPIYIWLSKGTRYHLNTCPLIFNEAFLSNLMLAELTDSRVKLNMLEFEPTNRTLQSTVNSLRLSGYGLRFSSKIFPLAVFAKTVSLYLSGTVNSFEASSLKQSQLIAIALALSKLKMFFHNNPGWLNEVNKRQTFAPLMIELKEPEEDPTNSIDQDRLHYSTWIESRQRNAFDDSSFCIFYQIERYALNVLFYGDMIAIQANKSCSCLLFWIVSFHRLQDYDCSNQVRLNRECNFSKMAVRCSIEKVELLAYKTIYDTILDLEFFKYLADVWLVPVTSLFGIFANFLVIRTFRKIKRSPEYRRNKLTDKGRFMWEYTYYNSWFLLLHGFIFLLGPLTTCIELDGIFCSAFINSSMFRLYYLFVEKLMGNTFRLAANMSSTMFVLYRFGLNTEKLVRLRKVKPRKSVASLFILSLLISVITLFTNEKFTFMSLGYSAFAYFLDIEFDILKSGLFLQSAFLLNTFLVTTLFTLLNMGIDLRLLSLLRSQNTERRKEEAEKRITKMVILNGLFSFLFRLPEMITAFLLLIFTLDHHTFPYCIVSSGRYHSVCPMLFSISHFLLTISYLENLILLYYFNDSFRKNFKWPLKTASAEHQTRP
nr:G protein-coupled receptor [Proales similis]